ncbi:Metallo-dependent phosphatase [Exidia glandulosa HHB12029]|uniref:Metallo-dependent phosphatase n=1 Tax=Exidia glandulosa HHB12029 TaxID=1314781 RepID=A0A165B6Z8_EXIGL|nr:Metallo-dependent phosphatase [Exidia glandulosa HHB12029]
MLYSTLLTFAAVGAVALAAPPQNLLSRARSKSELDPYPGKPKVTFARDGSFKLLVFSDLHFGENPWDWWGPEQDANSTRLMRRVLADERPDYVVINGDLITGENTFRENLTKLIDEIVAPLNEVGVPFSSTHGNHDNNINITHAEEIQREQKVAPRSYTRFAPPGVGGDQGPGNYWVPIYKHASDPAPALVLWFFDSQAGIAKNSTFENQIPLNDWVDQSVVGWMESEIALQNKAWGPATERGAIAFVHIPPHIVESLQQTLNSTQDPGLNADELGEGSTQSSWSFETTGNDGPFWDAIANQTLLPNLHAVVSGHDHGNEWCKRSGPSPSQDIVFCFAKHSGYGGYGQAEWGYGVRMFKFAPGSDVRRSVDTWIRLEEGEVRAKVRLDATYS